MEYKELDGKKYLIIRRDWSKAKDGEIPEIEWCPFCDGVHRHGIFSDGKTEGLIYNSHCLQSRNVVASDGSILKSTDGFWLVEMNKNVNNRRR